MAAEKSTGYDLAGDAGPYEGVSRKNDIYSKDANRFIAKGQLEESKICLYMNSSKMYWCY